MSTTKRQRIFCMVMLLGIGKVCAVEAGAAVERYKDEGLYLARLTELQFGIITEGYVGVDWNVVRSPTINDYNFLPGLTSQGLTWEAASKDVWGSQYSSRAHGVTTNHNWARSGLWGLYEFHSGEPYPTTIRISSAEPMYGVGIWINTNPDGIDTGFLFEDRTTANAPGYVLPGYGAMYPGDNPPGSGHEFIGIVDPDGFDSVVITGTLEVNEKGFLEGGAIFGADDAIIAVAPAQECNGDTNGDQIVDVNDISYVLFRLGGAAPDGDANGDGAVDVNDISYVLFRLDEPCP